MFGGENPFLDSAGNTSLLVTDPELANLLKAFSDAADANGTPNIFQSLGIGASAHGFHNAFVDFQKAALSRIFDSGELANSGAKIAALWKVFDFSKNLADTGAYLTDTALKAAGYATQADGVQYFKNLMGDIFDPNASAASVTHISDAFDLTPQDVGVVTNLEGRLAQAIKQAGAVIAEFNDAIYNDPKFDNVKAV